MSTNATLTLYYAPRTRSFAALWLLEELKELGELGEEYRLESFDIETARQKQADYLALNPMGKVPLIVHGKLPVSELGAIFIHLADSFPRAGLGPSIEDPQRPAFLKWIFFSSAIMEPAFAQKIFQWEIPAKSAAWGSFDQMLQVLTDALAESTWLLGESFSSADVLVGSALRFGQIIGIIPGDGPIQAYISRLKQRDAFVRAMAIEERESDRFPPVT
ncbi:MAG: glutathione S-transferase [bacterium]|nr:glutathione S-transferase [bacterium]